MFVCVLFCSAAIAVSEKPVLSTWFPDNPQQGKVYSYSKLHVWHRKGVTLLNSNGSKFLANTFMIHGRNVNWKCATAGCNGQTAITAPEGFGGTAGDNFEYHGHRDWGVVIYAVDSAGNRIEDQIYDVTSSDKKMEFSNIYGLRVAVNDITGPNGHGQNYAYDDNTGVFDVVITLVSP